jgi:hypothetical protein
MLMFPKEKATRTKRKFRDARPGMSPSHLKRVRRLPCCVCGARGPSQVHHLKRTGSVNEDGSITRTIERGMGLTSTDRNGIPLCWKHHGEVEVIGSNNETAWLAERGVEAIQLANTLWDNTLDFDAMEAAFSEHTLHNLLRTD